MIRKTTNPQDTYTPFPVELLPEVVSEFVEEVVESQNCAPEFAVLPLISCLGAAIGNAASVNPKSDWSAPSIFWTVTIGESGTGKSPVFKEATQFIVDLENEAYAECVESTSDYENRLSQWKKTSGDPAPTPPNCNRFYVEDTTTEALMSVLETTPTGLVVINDELSGWFASFDRYFRSGSGGDAAKWLKLWDACPVSIDRKTGSKKHCRVAKPIVGIAGTIQPSVLWDVVKAKNVENGMFARFLIAFPPASPQTWQEAEPSSKTREKIKKLFKDLYSLNRKSTSEESGTLRLKFASFAKNHWIDFYNENQELVSKSLPPLSYAFAKMDQYALRFACLYHLIENVGKPEIPKEINVKTIQSAIQTMMWFRRETERAYGLVIDGTEEQKVEKLISKIESKNGKISVRDLQHSNSRRYKTADDASHVLQSLVDKQLGHWNHKKSVFYLGEDPYSEENMKL